MKLSVGKWCSKHFVQQKTLNDIHWNKWRYSAIHLFSPVSEEQCLNQIYSDEQFGAVDYQQTIKAEEKKK